MKLGVYNAILHDRPLPEALKVIANLGLTGIEINTGGFLPAVHVPTMDQILESDDPSEKEGRARLRIRLPRGERRDSEHAPGASLRGTPGRH